jgi:hypothetical protein
LPVGPKPIDYLPAPALPTRRARLPVTVGLPTVTPTGVVAERPPADEPPHVEAAMLEAVNAGEQKKWLLSAGEAAKRVAEGYKPELERLDLVPGNRGDWAKAAGLSCAALLLAYSICGIIAAAKTPEVNPNVKEPPVAMILGCVGGMFASMLVGTGAGQALPRNRRGDRILAEARERNGDLIPCGRPWQRLSPAELALSVSLFGLKGWATRPPLMQLYDALNPPPPPSNDTP